MSVPPSLTGKVCEGSGHLTVLGYEPTEIVAETQEALQLLYCAGFWTVPVFVGFTGINTDAVCTDDVA
jgi:hypothetical protein